ncbi:MAG: D-2-hydroxyacid dehydrogenase [Bacillaceae bacterium]|nr:D-2-hydroxyacid dehydrogenase [Bacillaceae bacterium]
MKKLVITKNVTEKHVQSIKDAAPNWEIVYGKEPEQWLSHLKDAEIIAGWPKQDIRTFIDENQNLKWIQNWAAGINALPLESIKNKNIWVTNASGVHAYPISETIIGLMLAWTRKIHTYIRNQLQKKWHHEHMRLEIHTKTIGIIGVGAIGQETAKIAKAFGMHVLGLRRTGKPFEHVDEMFTPDRLHEMLEKCDYVVMTAPLTKETEYMLKEEHFQVMKSSAFFINISRGRTVDEKALIHALQSGEIAGAGLDVFDNEPLPEDHPLWEMENVIITPHTAGSTEHYNDRMVYDIFLPNLKAYIKGKQPPINLVDVERGY